MLAELIFVSFLNLQLLLFPGVQACFSHDMDIWSKEHCNDVFFQHGIDVCDLDVRVRKYLCCYACKIAQRQSNNYAKDEERIPLPIFFDDPSAGNATAKSLKSTAQATAKHSTVKPTVKTSEASTPSVGGSEGSSTVLSPTTPDLPCTDKNTRQWCIKFKKYGLFYNSKMKCEHPLAENHCRKSCGLCGKNRTSPVPAKDRSTPPPVEEPCLDKYGRKWCIQFVENGLFNRGRNKCEHEIAQHYCRYSCKLC